MGVADAGHSVADRDGAKVMHADTTTRRTPVRWDGESDDRRAYRRRGSAGQALRDNRKILKRIC